MVGAEDLLSDQIGVHELILDRAVHLCMNETHDDVLEQRLDAVERLDTEASDMLGSKTLFEGLPSFEPDASADAMRVVAVKAFDVDERGGELMGCSEEHLEGVGERVCKSMRSGSRIGKESQIGSEKALGRNMVQNDLGRGRVIVVVWGIRGMRCVGHGSTVQSRGASALESTMYDREVDRNDTHFCACSGSRFG